MAAKPAPAVSAPALFGAFSQPGCIPAHSRYACCQSGTELCCRIGMVNAGQEGFVRAAALELPRNLRVKVVSPVWVSETLAKTGSDPDQGMPAMQVARAYLESVESRRNGEVLAVRDFA